VLFGKRRGWTVLIALALTLALTLAACGGTAPQEEAEPGETGGESEQPPAEEKTLVIGRSISTAVSLDPAVAYEGDAIFAVHQFYDTLVTFDKDDLSHVIPALATEWEVSDEGTVWTFKLRDDVKFHSGNPLTAEDVVYSFDRVIGMNDQPAWLLTQTGMEAGSTEAIDDYTVKITLPEPFNPAAFLACLAYTVASVVDSEEVKAHEVDGDWGENWVLDHSAGSGPFKLDEWEREVQYLMSANPDHYNGPPGVDRVIVRHIAEPASQKMQLEKGDIDIAMNLNNEQIAELEGVEGVNVITGLDDGTEYLGMNVGFEPFDDVRVRNAVKWALNYDEIVEYVLLGNAIVNQGFIPKGYAGYDDTIYYTHDEEKAKELLAEAGLPDGFETEMLASTGPVAGVPCTDVATKMQSDLADVGISVDIRQMTGGEMYEIYRAQEAKMVFGGWGPDYADPDSNAKPFANYRMNQLAWRLQWYPDDLADLVEQAAALSDWEDRAPIYAELTRRVAEEGPFAIIFQPMMSFGVRDNIEGFVYNSMYTSHLADVTKK